MNAVTKETALSVRDHPYGPNSDTRFSAHQRQPRADKLDQRQRQLCAADVAYREALRARVSDPVRFAAFLDNVPSYPRVDRLCPKCGSHRRRTRDRSCYTCHLSRSGANYERIKAGIAPVVARSNDSHLDLLQRQRAERQGEHMARDFGTFVAKRWPTGRLEIEFINGHRQHDFSELPEWEMIAALRMYPALKDALHWAGWTLPYMPEA